MCKVSYVLFSSKREKIDIYIYIYILVPTILNPSKGNHKFHNPLNAKVAIIYKLVCTNLHSNVLAAVCYLFS